MESSGNKDKMVLKVWIWIYDFGNNVGFMQEIKASKYLK